MNTTIETVASADWRPGPARSRPGPARL